MTSGASSVAGAPFCTQFLPRVADGVTPPPMSTLRGKQLRWLRAKAHHLKPMVIIGQDRVTEGVMKHVESALEQHELLKVRLTAAEKVEAVEAATQLVEGTGAILVQRIGHTLVLYRRRQKGAPTIKIPKA
jgi:RNA-binding protein